MTAHDWSFVWSKWTLQHLFFVSFLKISKTEQSHHHSLLSKTPLSNPHCILFDCEKKSVCEIHEEPDKTPKRAKNNLVGENKAGNIITLAFQSIGL